MHGRRGSLSTAGRIDRLFVHLVHFGVDAFAEVAPIAVARCQKLSSFFGSLGLNAPIFGSGNEERCVECFQRGSSF